MTDKITPIDIPKLRAEVLKSISIFRRRARLTEVMEAFIKALPPKIDRRVAAKLHDHLVEQAEELKVYRVDFKKSDPMPGIRDRYRLSIHMYDMGDLGETSFELMQDDLEAWDVGHALAAERKWGEHADFLESRLKPLPYAAQRFNAALEDMRKHAVQMSIPVGDTFPVYPLADAFCYYRLT